MDLNKEQQIINELHRSGMLLDLDYRLKCNDIRQMRQDDMEDVKASMTQKWDDMQKEILLEALAPELAKKDTKAAKRPCFNGLDKYTTGQLKDELRRRKGN